MALNIKSGDLVYVRYYGHETDCYKCRIVDAVPNESDEVLREANGHQAYIKTQDIVAYASYDSPSHYEARQRSLEI